MPLLTQFPLLRKAVIFMIQDNVPPFLRDDLLAQYDALPLDASLPLEHANTELSLLTEEQFEDALLGEEGEQPVSPETDQVLTWLFEQL